jgi:uncharacterized protein (TIGR02145 family)
MKIFYSISFFAFYLLSLIPTSLFSQSPQSIPYQAVVRNVDGSAMSSTAMTMTFKIHDVTAAGTIVYQESHTTTSNAQGLVVLNVGQGQPSVGTFDNINWGSGAKFLHVVMSEGNGEVDLGTKQMMSVPYALYSEDTDVSVSSTGDTLTIGGRSVVIPGISAANQQVPISNSGLGSQVLIGNTTCTNEFISITGCGGQTSLTYDGRVYDLVEIGGQCWFADNLATDQYRNGDPIPNGAEINWATTISGAYSYYYNDPSYDSIYAKQYNWYTTVDSRGLCPTGWHVPSDCEWMYLEGSLGLSVADQQLAEWRGPMVGTAIKSPLYWWGYLTNPAPTGTNSSGFSAIPNGHQYPGGGFDNVIGGYANWWTSTSLGNLEACHRGLVFNNPTISRVLTMDKHWGHSVRCLKD